MPRVTDYCRGLKTSDRVIFLTLTLGQAWQGLQSYFGGIENHTEMKMLRKGVLVPIVQTPPYVSYAVFASGAAAAPQPLQGLANRWSSISRISIATFTLGRTRSR